MWNTLNDKSDRLFKRLFFHSKMPVEDQRLELLVKKFEEKEYLQKKYSEQNSYDYEKAFRRLLKLKKRPVFGWVGKCAALFVLLLGCSAVLYYVFVSDSDRDRETAETCTFVPEGVPGSRKAMLIKEDGERVMLENETVSIREMSAKIQVDSTGIRYEMLKKDADCTEKYHSLIVPRGGEYALVLSDGSQVWLNSDSELSYPVVFKKEKREVFISGEAYFNVKKQDKRPFVVRTLWGRITVAGTEFNVRNYPDAERIVMTLVNGKIAYHTEQGEKICLSASQELSIDREGHRSLTVVDTRYATGWKNGRFLFQEKSLEEILLQLQRWYDIQVVYKNEKAKDLHFSGDLSRYKNIGTFIKMFEASSDATFEMKNECLIVDL